VAEDDLWGIPFRSSRDLLIYHRDLVKDILEGPPSVPAPGAPWVEWALRDFERALALLPEDTSELDPILWSAMRGVTILNRWLNAWNPDRLAAARSRQGAQKLSEPWAAVYREWKRRDGKLSARDARKIFVATGEPVPASFNNDYWHRCSEWRDL
jgi:hypothetical protein